MPFFELNMNIFPKSYACIVPVVTVSSAFPGCFGFCLRRQWALPMASAVVLFVAATPMAVMTVVVTVRAVLANRSGRHQISSCLLRETCCKASLCSTRGCKPPAKPKHWHGLQRTLFSCHFQCLPVHLFHWQTVCVLICLSLFLCHHSFL